MPIVKKNENTKSTKAKDEDEAYKCSAKGKPAKEKDPNAPKRPLSSYFVFMMERRSSLKKE